MRHMSFMLTQPQVRARTKTVTRRLGWMCAYPGLQVLAVEKCQGLKKGEKVVPLCVIRIKDSRWEPLGAITKEDCIAEGFPEMEPQDFIDMFCKHNKVTPYVRVNRIEFEYLQEAQ
jgi:hypothetical protein